MIIFIFKKTAWKLRMYCDDLYVEMYTIQSELSSSLSFCLSSSPDFTSNCTNKTSAIVHRPTVYVNGSVRRIYTQTQTHNMLECWTWLYCELKRKCGARTALNCTHRMEIHIHMRTHARTKQQVCECVRIKMYIHVPTNVIAYRK